MFGRPEPRQASELRRWILPRALVCSTCRRRPSNNRNRTRAARRFLERHAVLLLVRNGLLTYSLDPHGASVVSARLTLGFRGGAVAPSAETGG